MLKEGRENGGFNGDYRKYIYSIRYINNYTLRTNKPYVQIRFADCYAVWTIMLCELLRIASKL